MDEIWPHKGFCSSTEGLAMNRPARFSSFIQVLIEKYQENHID